MWSSDRRVFATLAVLGLASLAGFAPTDARCEGSRERHEQRPSEGPRQAGRREAESRPSHRAYPARAQGVRAAEVGQASNARAHPVANGHRELVDRSFNERRPATASAVGAAHFGAAGQVREVSRGPASGQIHVVRYGSGLSGTVEHTIRPGLISRTFVGGGHVLYTHVYQRQVWHQYGRAFAYETFVPAVRFPGIYYAWALGAWPRPVSYRWGWQVQAWYPTYGPLFTPYAVYASPDLWMTDYIIAQSLQTTYQAQSISPASEPSQPSISVAPAPDSGVAPPAPDSTIALPAAEPSDVAPAAPPGDAPPAAPNSAPAPPVGLPPAITAQVKAQLNAQIKVQLQEQQAAVATPATLTTQSTPPALRPNHVFFQVVQPLEVASGSANGRCSLSANDYIKRTGGMSNDDWMIPVVVELSRSTDCPEGLKTRIGLNDLNAMENEQEAQVMEAMQAASKSMGPNGPPSSAGVHPTLIADGRATADPMALDAIRQAQ